MRAQQLAIVIPAYKSDFLDRALSSIARQTCKAFKVYIGNDQSPYILDEIIGKYSNILELSYIKFDSNLGGQDLTAQWDRCIQMVGDEEWVWLFSDDDEMDDDCVQNFYQCRKAYPGYDLYHFNLRKINAGSEFIGVESVFPEHLGVDDLLFGRLRSTLQTTVVEYIFRKEKFLEVGGFQKFDLAWGSDDATWIKVAAEKGIRTVPNSFVHWRRSRQNISSQQSSDIVMRQMNARFAFSAWVMDRCHEGMLRLDKEMLAHELETWYFKFLRSSLPFLSRSEVKMLVEQYDRGHRGKTKLLKELGYQAVWLKEVLKKALKPS